MFNHPSSERFILVKAVEILLKDDKMQKLEARLERIGKEEQHE